MVSFFALMLLFVFVYAILGMNLFGAQWNFDGETPRKNFDSFFWAMATVFQVLTIEDWNQVMYHGIRGAGLHASLYFISLVVFGNLILLNLFVAILIEGFGAEEDDEDEEEEEKGKEKGSVDVTAVKGTERETNPGDSVESGCESGGRGSGRGGNEPHSKYTINEENDSHSDRIRKTGTEANVKHGLSIDIPEGSNKEKDVEAPRVAAVKLDDETDIDYSGESMPQLRSCCRDVVNTQSFDNVVMIFILLSSICLAMESPSVEDGSDMRQFLDIAGHVFTVVFSIEMIIKILALHFFVVGDGVEGIGRADGAYIMSEWNQLDFFLVMVSWVDMAFMIAKVGGNEIKMLRILRMLRTLRPLRMISRAPGLKMVVNSLISSLKPLSSTLVIILFIFLIFGILGTQMMMGQMWYCDGLTEAQLDNVYTKAECVAAGGSWVNQRYNFDHLGMSILTLLVVASRVGWVDIMYQGVDCVGVDMQPKQNNKEAMFLFFAGFILVGAFFVMNMFVGIVVENFQKCAAERQAEKKEFESSLEYLESLDVTPAKEVPVEPKCPEDHGPCRRWSWEVSHSTEFDIVIAVIIILNICTMAIEHYDQPQTLTDVLIWVNVVFTVIFIAEAAMKLVADGLYDYISDSWNQFDLFIVIISIVGCYFDLLSLSSAGSDESSASLPINPTLLRILRILRIARILKLVKNLKNLCLLLDGVKRALPQVGNLCILLLLVYFIFSALGIQLFGRLACTDSNPCDGLGKHANFESFGMAMLTLFRITTGDNWAGIMKDTLRAPPLCDDSTECVTNCCASRVAAPFFFIFFCLVTQFTLLNIVVAVMMEQLEASVNDLEEDEHEEKQRDQLVIKKLFLLWSGMPKEKVMALIQAASLMGIEENTQEYKSQGGIAKREEEEELSPVSPKTPLPPLTVQTSASSLTSFGSSGLPSMGYSYPNSIANSPLSSTATSLDLPTKEGTLGPPPKAPVWRRKLEATGSPL